MKQTFYIVLPIAEVAALYKDPGMIPAVMNDLGYDAHFVSFLRKQDIPPYAVEFANKIQLETIELKQKSNTFLPWHSKEILMYLWKHAKEIDILNLYYLKHSILYALCYKLRNPHGVLYIKLDLTPDACKKEETDKIAPIRTGVYKWYLQHVPDVVSAETVSAVQYVQSRYRINYPKLLLIPNGIDDKWIQQNNICIAPFGQRENIILTVGRIGAYDKNNEFMLEALSKTDLKDWKFIFVGKVVEGFDARINEFYERNASLRDKVVFTGECTDRLKLFEWYNRAKVFCFSSRRESFGIVLAEAQYFGNYILSTPVSSLPDFIGEDERLGKAVRSSSELACEIQSIVDNQNDISLSHAVRLEQGQRYAWSRICRQLKAAFEQGNEI